MHQEMERQEAILFGNDKTERIVAVEINGREMLYWQRNPDDVLVRCALPFVPWLLSTTPTPNVTAKMTELEGHGLRYLYEFDSWDGFLDARFRMREGQSEIIAWQNAVKQALTRNGMTLFKGMTLKEVHRLQLDIETEGLSPNDESHRVLLIVISDNRGYQEVIHGDEREMLERMVNCIRERDPDIIEGHNIYGFDLPFLIERAKRAHVRLSIGRDGSEPRTGNGRNFAIGGLTRPFAPIYIFGRHIFDTFLAVQRFDVARGALSSYGLKSVARAFGIAVEDRIELPRDEMSRLFKEELDTVITYAAQDVIETARLAEIIAPNEFYQTQMIPDSFGSVATTGSGEKINTLFVRAYLAAGHSIPLPRESRSCQGGYTDIRAKGVLDHVVKADVESLYPSVMMTDRIRPESDTLDVFLPALTELTRRRLEAKSRVQSSEGTDKLYWDGLQGSFKVLINSFYGYLGAAVFNFNDYEAAERVTSRGRDIVKRIAARIEQDGGQVIEIDTDGVYFVPPKGVEDELQERNYVNSVGEVVPQGIRLAFDGRYQAMISLKTKNYVLQAYDGKKSLHGASLRSRADEPYGREFLERSIDLLLSHNIEKIGELYFGLVDEILHRRIPIRKLARRERITEKTFRSSGRQRLGEVARNVPVGDYVMVYERENGKLGLLQDYQANGEDERTIYYMDKLYKFAQRLREAFEADFPRLIPRPDATGLPGQGPQTMLDLF